MKISHAKKDGFRSGYSTIDYLQTIDQMMKEKTTEDNKPFCLTFVDYEKAVIKSQWEQSIIENYIKALDNYCNNSTAERHS